MNVQASSFFFDAFRIGYPFQPTGEPCWTFTGHGTMPIFAVAFRFRMLMIGQRPPPNIASLPCAAAVVASNVPPGGGDSLSATSFRLKSAASITRGSSYVGFDQSSLKLLVPLVSSHGMIAAKYSGPAAYPNAPVLALICSHACRKSSQVHFGVGAGTPALANR